MTTTARKSAKLNVLKEKKDVRLNSDDDESFESDESDGSEDSHYNGASDYFEPELPDDPEASDDNMASGRISALRAIESALEDIALLRALEDFPETRT